MVFSTILIKSHITSQPQQRVVGDVVFDFLNV